jgi:hypothetical protein
VVDREGAPNRAGYPHIIGPPPTVDRAKNFPALSAAKK